MGKIIISEITESQMEKLSKILLVSLIAVIAYAGIATYVAKERYTKLIQQEQQLTVMQSLSDLYTKQADSLKLDIDNLIKVLGTYKSKLNERNQLIKDITKKRTDNVTEIYKMDTPTVVNHFYSWLTDSTRQYNVPYNH